MVEKQVFVTCATKVLFSIPEEATEGYLFLYGMRKRLLFQIGIIHVYRYVY